MFEKKTVVVIRTAKNPRPYLMSQVYERSFYETFYCMDTWAFLTRRASILSQVLSKIIMNKAGYTATPVACGWAGAIIEVSGTFGQEQ